MTKDEQLKEFSTMVEEKNNALFLDIQKLTENHQEALKKKEVVRNETRKETELAIRTQ